MVDDELFLDDFLSVQTSWQLNDSKYLATSPNDKDVSVKEIGAKQYLLHFFIHITATRGGVVSKSTKNDDIT